MKENNFDLNLIKKKISFYCTYKERSQGEVEKKLNTYNLSLTQKENILNWLKKNDFLNEGRFIKSFVRSKFNYNSWGRIKINFTLKSKGIQKDLINEALKEISEEEYKKKLKFLIEKKTQKKSLYLDKKSFAKLMNFLKSKGFEEDLIRKLTNFF